MPYRVVLLFSLLTASTGAATGADLEKSCSYTTFSWNVVLRKSVSHQRIEHPYDRLTAEEVDPLTGCTVCEEDQEEIAMPPLHSFRICRKFAPQVREALRELTEAGEPVFEVIGYRVGKTRGDIDANGNRTGFSNHSFGVALDINSHLNGLYDNCISFNPSCRLIRGGRWQPNAPGGLRADSHVVKRLIKAGFKWGGEIEGKQKDFMHFSPTGY